MSVYSVFRKGTATVLGTVDQAGIVIVSNVPGFAFLIDQVRRGVASERQLLVVKREFSGSKMLKAESALGTTLYKLLGGEIRVGPPCADAFIPGVDCVDEGVSKTPLGSTIALEEKLRQRVGPTAPEREKRPGRTYRRRLDDNARRKIAERYESGESIHSIARRFGASRTSVRLAIEKAAKKLAHPPFLIQ